jgi:hypothetical protein
MGFKIKEFPYELRVGRDINTVSSLSATIADQENDFDFIIVDVCHAMNFRNHKTISSRDIALTRSGNSRWKSLTNIFRYLCVEHVLARLHPC